MSYDLRDFFVSYLIRSLFPDMSPTAIHKLINHLKKFEKKMIKVAQSLQEYCRLLSEKICEIKLEQNMKKS